MCFTININLSHPYQSIEIDHFILYLNNFVSLSLSSLIFSFLHQGLVMVKSSIIVNDARWKGVVKNLDPKGVVALHSPLSLEKPQLCSNHEVFHLSLVQTLQWIFNQTLLQIEPH